MERQPAGVASLAVYSPEFGVTEETEEEKLLYYYPTDTPTDKKLRHVGLCEAMVNFTRCLRQRSECGGWAHDLALAGHSRPTLRASLYIRNSIAWFL